MKKRFFTVSAIVAISGSLMFSSCIGPFNLSNKLLAWNQTVDNKFVNEVIFFAFHIIPVYPISYVADILVFNSIEFWTGENPIEAGIVKQVQGTDGIYTVETLEDGYKIENEAGQEMKLVYDKETNVWSAVVDNTTTKIIKIEDDKKAVVYLPDGKEMNVDLTAEGVLAFRQTIETSMYYAAK